MSRRGIEMSLAQVQAHQRKHGFEAGAMSEQSSQVNGSAGRLGSGGETQESSKRSKLTRKDRMTRPEREMAMILEARRLRGDILQWLFEGISLAWGVDPKTGKQMWYTPDFTIFGVKIAENFIDTKLLFIETKGSRLFNAQLVRFRGCRACWPQFNFELHQLSRGTWTHVE